MMIQGTPVVVCIDIIRKYIFEKTGQLIEMQSVITPEHEEKFIEALNVACNYFNITL
jgi:hypothetical protein